MGYTTEFYGEFTITPPLNAAETSFLIDFNQSRRMNRTRGPLFVHGSGPYGQGRDSDVINANSPHPDQPGLWCKWTPNEDGTALIWDEGEKFYYAPEWLSYIIHWLLAAPDAQWYIDQHLDEDPRLAEFTCDHILNGVVQAEGEEQGDVWTLEVVDNTVIITEQ